MTLPGALLKTKDRGDTKFYLRKCTPVIPHEIVLSVKSWLLHSISLPAARCDQKRLESNHRRRQKCESAFLLQHSKRALEGDGAATRTTLAVIEYAKERFSTLQGIIRTITRVIVDPGSVTYALMPLRMAKKLDPCRETARMVLEPWLVEAALACLDRILSPEEQRSFVKATRTPHKLKWPKWWTE
jgi:hypothetical protein